MALIATVGASNANAYTTVARAVTLLTEERLYGSVFTSASAENQAAALIWAASLLDVCFDFPGTPTYETQSRRFPRVGARDADDRLIDAYSIPLPIEMGSAVLGLELLKRDRTAEPVFQRLGVSDVTIDSIKATFNPSYLGSLIPQNVLAVVGVLGTPSEYFVIPGAGKIQKLRRS